MNTIAYISLLSLATVGPFGKLLIKKSVEYSSNSKRRILNAIGILFLALLGPLSNFSAYYYADNAIVAPVAASGVLINLLFAKAFLQEGEHMNRYTVLGILAFIVGLFLLVFTYSSFVGNEGGDENIDWGVLSLFLGLWALSITLLTNTSNIFYNNKKIQLFTWSITCGLFGGSDIIVSMDKWVYNHDRADDSDEFLKIVVATIFYIISGILCIYVLNELLTDPDNSLHVVATIVTSTTLLCDVIADCFVFQRYLEWDQTNYAMAIVGVLLMVLGINVMQSSDSEHAYKKVPQEAVATQTRGALAPIPSLSPP